MTEAAAPAATHAPDSLEALKARHGERYRWLVLATVMIGTVASILASTIVNVAVPALSHHFGLGQERAQWVSAGFMAAMTLSMLTTPWLLARFGYRRTYLGAVAVLGAGGAIGGFSTDYTLVLAMRAAEGLAAGVLQPIPSIIILRSFGPGEQGKAMGIFGFGVVLAPAIGPSVGGVLVEHFGWRSIFFFVLPFCVLAAWLARRYLPHARPAGGAPGAHDVELDLPGLALLAVMILALLNGLVHLHAASSIEGPVLIGVALVALAAFLLRQRRAPHPLLALSLFRERAFAMGAIVAFVYGMGLFGSTYLVPVFMQSALHFRPTEAGAVLLPAGLVLAVTIPLAGRMADRHAPRWLIAIGVLLLAGSFALMAGVAPDTALWMLVTIAIVGRIGLGLILPSLNLAAVRRTEPALLPQAASGINFLRQLGGAVGVSVVGIVLEWRLRAHANDHPLAAFGETFWMIATVCALAAFAAWRMGDTRVR